MEIIKGYKLSEVGTIPKDWEVKRLGDIIQGVEYGSSAKSKAEGNTPVLRMGNIQNGKIDFSDLVFTDNDKEILKYTLKKDDVLFNRTNTIDLVGKTGIYKGEFPAIFAGYLIRIKRNADLLNADYLNYWLNTSTAKKYGHAVLSIAVGQANINGAKLKTYPIPVPPTLSEQTAIATALSDTDALINSLEKLIAKKRNIKQGAMQALLKPKKGWVVKRLGDITESISSGKSNSKGSGGIYPIYGSTGIIGSANAYDYNGPKLLIARVGANAGLVNIVNGKYCVSDNALIVSYNQKVIDTKYLFYYLVSIKLNTLVFGSGQPLITGSQLANLYLPVPELDAQNQVSNILSDMDSEISALESKLSKYKQIKAGMMQNLLTGKIRLV